MIQMERPYMMIIRNGDSEIMVRLTKSWFLYRSVLALSNLCSSVSSRPNARMTCMPVSISLDTAFSASMRLCIILNLGMAMANITDTRSSIAMTPVTMTKFMCACVW